MKLPRFFGLNEPDREPPPPPPPVEPPEPVHQVVEIDPDQLKTLSNVFAAPKWLRDLGLASWLLAGVAIVLVGGVWLAAITSTIVDPVLIGLVIATVASPLVGWLQAHHVGRGLGAAIVLLVIVAVAALVLIVVVGGISSQRGAISDQAHAAADKGQSWLGSLGLNSSGKSGAIGDVEKATPEVMKTLVNGLVSGIKGLASMAFFLSFAALALFFALKDGPEMRKWGEGQLHVAPSVARVITGGVIRSLRRYFAGVTLVAAFNGVVVGIGALILGVPLAGTIAVVTFVTAYVPYIGAIVAGAFSVVLALGSKGTTTAVIMLVIVLLANGLLQNIFQPIAFGATLKLNPLLVLVVTIGAGCLFGMLGLILAAPLTSAAREINRELSAARRAARVAGSPEAAVPAEAGGG
jgi:predicted PurR-regulated permease PerM